MGQRRDYRRAPPPLLHSVLKAHRRCLPVCPSGRFAFVVRVQAPR